MARHQTRPRARNAAAEAAGSVTGMTPATETAEMMQDIMDRAGTQVREGVQQGLTMGSRQFGVLGEQAFESWMRTSNEALQSVLALNVELAAWGREQLDDSIGAVRSLSQCRSFGDACGVQLGLMRSTMENSMRHANKVLSLTANVMAAGASTAQAQAQAD